MLTRFARYLDMVEVVGSTPIAPTTFPSKTDTYRPSQNPWGKTGENADGTGEYPVLFRRSGFFNEELPSAFQASLFPHLRAVS